VRALEIEPSRDSDERAMLLTKLGDLLRREYDWSKELAAIKAAILILATDADAVRKSR
jgi:hypothetical protein